MGADLVRDGEAAPVADKVRSHGKALQEPIISATAMGLRTERNAGRACDALLQVERTAGRACDALLQTGRSAPRWADYLAAISARVMSSMRLEKPHSLSYQDSTLTRVPPMTRVWVLS